MSTFAAIDLGSTSFHLLVAEIQQGEVVPVHKLSQKVRLAEGICSENLLCANAINRGLKAIRIFSEVLNEWQPVAVRAVGTQALRQAANKNIFIDEAEQMLGFDIDVIPGKQEAELIWSAIRSSASIEGGHLLTLDIGGGSTELALGNGGLDDCCSMTMGCVTYTDQFFADGLLTPENYQAAYQAAIKHIQNEVPFIDQPWDLAMGSSGTIKAVCNFATLQKYSELNGHERIATRECLQQMKQALFDAGSIRKLHLKGVSEDRTPLIPGGLAILEALYETLGIENLTLSKSAMREAVIHQLVQHSNQ